jgi:hypothetical protein
MVMSTYKWSIGSMWFVSNRHIYCKTQNNTAQQLCHPLEQFVSTRHYVHSNREWRSSPDVVALVSPPKKWWGSLYYIYCRLGESKSATADADLLGVPVKAKSRVSVRLPFSYSKHSHGNNLCNCSASAQSEFTFHQNPIVSTGRWKLKIVSTEIC